VTTTFSICFPPHLALATKDTGNSDRLETVPCNDQDDLAFRLRV
jgi:hypothetical protein